MRIVHVKAVEWEALYIDGVKEFEGHEIEWPILMNELALRGMLEFYDVDCNGEQEQRLMEESYFPDKLEEFDASYVSTS